MIHHIQKVRINHKWVKTKTAAATCSSVNQMTGHTLYSYLLHAVQFQSRELDVSITCNYWYRQKRETDDYHCFFTNFILNKGLTHSIPEV